MVGARVFTEWKLRWPFYREIPVLGLSESMLSITLLRATGLLFAVKKVLPNSSLILEFLSQFSLARAGETDTSSLLIL